ncbi:tautomerase family protein [Mycolicibacterium sp. 22603]|uniref:tautomerase family protein n=1 Tax=Mycolicibacterium sp. 22603 TaxID=3453950 RepID=UPI003F825D24
MPLWTIHHSPEVFTAEDKRALAGRITELYEFIGLPRFYVVVVFHETHPEDFYVGGEPSPAGVRVVIEHIARHSADTAGRRRITAKIEEILRPFVDKHEGVHWEFHVDETSEELWMINGLIPPPAGSDAEREWARTNTASVY